MKGEGRNGMGRGVSRKGKRGGEWRKGIGEGGEVEWGSVGDI